MLSSLYVENLAVMKRTEIEFDRGFNVLTGETGAGKSILIDAIGLITGDKSSRDQIRHGEARALVSARFFDCPDILDPLSALDVYPDDDGFIDISRTVSADGRAVSRIGGRQVPLQQQKDAASELISIHGQNDNVMLFSAQRQLSFLDHYADCADLLADYRPAYESVISLRNRIASLRQDGRDKARRIDLLKMQIAEIESAHLVIGEEETLAERKKTLRSAEKIAKQSRLVVKALYRGEKNLPAYELIKKAISALQSLGEFYPDADQAIEKLSAMLYDLEEIGLSAEDLSAGFGDNPDAELDKIEDRLVEISRLTRKYGSDIPEILAFLEACKKELSDIELSDVLLKEESAKLVQAEETADRLAGLISARRLRFGQMLERAVIDELSYLEMPKVRFSVSVIPQCDDNGGHRLSPVGYDEVCFLLSANPGEPLKPLAKIASGGELSRIMLALRSVNAADHGGQTLIFDEIDTGVSGKTAQKIGIRLRRLARRHQVICVTHSAQVAACADAHFLIRKQEIGERVESSVERLDRDGRIAELARIMGGLNITETLTESAEELLDSVTDDA